MIGESERVVELDGQVLLVAQNHLFRYRLREEYSELDAQAAFFHLELVHAVHFHVDCLV